MDQNPDWQRVSAILAAAIDVPEDGREAFVREACAGDVNLLAEIVALLAAHAKSGGFLEGPAVGFGSGTRSVATPGVSAAAAAAAQRFAAGQIVGRYRIDRLLGRGGMGEVYAADEIEHGRRVALKVLSGDLTSLEDRERFLREGRLASAINHPNSVYVFSSDIIEGHPIIVMELLGGGTLKDRVRKAGRLPAAEAVDAILQVIAGLEVAHAGGIVHRDVKPGNCFVDRDGTVKIGDFGLSVTTSAQLTQFVTTGAIRVTPQFAAPEQLKGAVPDIRADIYSVGATLFNLLTGQPPFDEAELLTLITRIVTEAPPSPRALAPAVPRGLAAAVVRCLAKDPDERYQTYAALRDALLPFRTGDAQAAPRGARIVAMAVDQVVLAIVIAIINALLLMTREPPFLTPAWPLLPFELCLIAYFLATESAWSASPGKRLLGLRVVAADGGRPRLVQVAIRTGIYVAAAVLPFLVPLEFWVRLLGPEDLPALGERAALLVGISNAVAIAGRFVPLALFVTARRANGWTGVHELLSGTRVCRMGVDVTRAPGDALSPVAAGRSARVTEPSGRRGSFVLGAAHVQADGATLWQAFDPALERDVWVRDAVAGTAVARAERRELARPGRLRWLGGQSGTPAWDAFEAPRGAPFTVMVSRPLPWRVVREWLADLARELAACEASDEAATFTLDHVWITAGGRAMLLDFPPPGAHPANGGTAVNPKPRAQRLLLDVALTALHGTAGQADTSERIEPPLPPAGTALLDALKAPEPQRTHDLLHLALRALTGATAVPRWSRAVPGLLLLVPFALIVIIASTLSRASGTGLTIGVDSADLPLHNTLVTIDALDRAGVMPTIRGVTRSRSTSRADMRDWRRVLRRSTSLWPRTARLAREIGRRHPVSSVGELGIGHRGDRP